MSDDPGFAAAGGRSTLLAVSLKIYFDHRRTLEWCTELRRAMSSRDLDRAMQVVVLPDFVSLPAVGAIFAGTTVRWGAQDLFWEDEGAFTGAVSGVTLRQVGCSHVVIGHAERGRYFHEDQDTFAAKAAAARRNGLTPIVCVGEAEPMPPDSAARACTDQLASICRSIITGPEAASIVVAYEPVWAIGAERPAPTDHIVRVCSAISGWLGRHQLLIGSAVIYGGSAGPGLLGAVRGGVDGLFLGRFAHDVRALVATMEEAAGALPHE